MHVFEKGNYSYSTKKSNKSKLKVNKNIKLTNINSIRNSHKKERKNIFTQTNTNYGNETIKEIMLRNNLTKRKNNDKNPTEPKYNQFLEKVINNITIFIIIK